MLYWILLVYLVVAFFFPIVGWLAAICMIAPVWMSIYKGRHWCGNYCPRGNFYDKLIYKLSRKKTIPAFLRRKAFRALMVGVIFTMFGIQMTLSWGNFPAMGRVFWNIIFLTTLVGITLGIVYSPRAWCTFCPMGSLSACVAPKHKKDADKKRRKKEEKHARKEAKRALEERERARKDEAKRNQDKEKADRKDKKHPQQSKDISNGECNSLSNTASHPTTAAPAIHTLEKPRRKGFLTIHITDACIQCKKCAKACPMQLKPYLAKGLAEGFMDTDCIKCGKCIEVCPKKCITLE